MNDAWPTDAAFRQRQQDAIDHARSRHRARLVEVFDHLGLDDAGAAAEAALDALTQWRDIEDGQPCRCDCHPQLPNSDRHDYGFDCNCTRPRESRRGSLQQLLAMQRSYWESPEGQAEHSAQLAEEAELQQWLAEHPGFVVHSHHGWAPETWEGEVDGHSFYFSARWDTWYIRIDVPGAEDIDDVRADTTAAEPDSVGQPRQQSLRGDLIATGTTEHNKYGATTVGRAQFILTAIRDHLRRAACTHHRGELDAIVGVIGGPVYWCPHCGTDLRES